MVGVEEKKNSWGNHRSRSGVSLSTSSFVSCAGLSHKLFVEHNPNAFLNGVLPPQRYCKPSVSVSWLFLGVCFTRVVLISIGTGEKITENREGVFLGFF